MHGPAFAFVLGCDCRPRTAPALTLDAAAHPPTPTPTPPARSSHRDAVTSCAWLPDSRRLLSGSVDKCILMHDIEGNELQRWKRPYRVQVSTAQRSAGLGGMGVVVDRAV